MKPFAPVVALALLLSPLSSFAADWFPTQWASQDTLQYRTDCPDEGEHWSYVWLVVLEGEVWVRLGTQAAGRVDCSTTKPHTTIRIGGQEFADIEMVHVPEMADAVATAMADKYISDVFVRYAAHPYTMKLVPASAEDAQETAEGAATATGEAEDAGQVEDDQAAPDEATP